MINDKYLWALTPDAKRFVEMMEREVGMDRDLAIAFLEALCPEEQIYSLDDESCGLVS